MASLIDERGLVRWDSDSPFDAQYCCGERRGPTETELAKATLHRDTRAATRHIRRHNNDDLDDLLRELFELPTLDHTLLLTLPRLATPDIERLRHAIDDDIDAIDDALPAVAARCDTPQRRLQPLHAVYRLRDKGPIHVRLAAAAAADLALTQSTLARPSLIEAAAIHTRAAPTASGLIAITH